MDKTAIRCDKKGSCGTRGSVTELIVCNSELDVAGRWALDALEWKRPLHPFRDL